MKLYHVSFHLMHDGNFIPRVPEQRLLDENDTIPRICACSSIEGCLTAMPGGGDYLPESLEYTAGIIKVFEFESEDFLTPDYLHQNRLVADADITQEYWLLKPVSPKKSYFLMIQDWDAEYIKKFINNILVIRTIQYVSLEEATCFNGEHYEFTIPLPDWIDGDYKGVKCINDEFIVNFYQSCYKENLIPVRL